MPGNYCAAFDKLRPTGFILRNPFVLSPSKHDNRLVQRFLKCSAPVMAYRLAKLAALPGAG